MTNYSKISKMIREQITYNGPERMGKSTEEKLGDPERNVYGDNPAMGRGTPDVERLASIRFQKVVDKLKQVSGIQDISTQTVQMMMQQELMRSVMAVKPIENQFIEQLQELAVKAGIKTTEVEGDRYNIIAKLTTGLGEISPEDFQFEPKNPEIPDENPEIENPEFDINNLTPDEKFQLEKHKRNIINGIIQGAAKKGHYIFQDPDVKSELDALNPNLYEYYLKIMAINDFFYFMVEDVIDQMSASGEGVEGKEEVEADEEGKITIKATGFLFPILCHEVIKGLEEALAIHGLPTDPEMSDQVRGVTDTLPNESITLKIGPELVEHIRHYLPDEMFDEANFGVKPFFYKILYEIPAKEFLLIIKYVISQDGADNTKAVERFREIFKEAVAMKERYEQNKGQSPDDDLDFLGGLGIGRAGEN